MSTLARRALPVAALALAGPAASQDAVEEDILLGEAITAQIAREARAVLEARCLSCHHPDAEDRKAVKSWPDALDVQAMLDDTIIELDAPELSYLLEIIDEGEMPPEDSDVGAVTGAERATLLAWIEAGAPALDVPILEAPAIDDPATDDPVLDDPVLDDPVLEDPVLDDPVLDDPVLEDPVLEDPPLEDSAIGDTAAPPSTPDDAAARAFAWTDLGVLHPALVHFPVGLLLATVLAELLVACGARGLRTTARFCAWLGFLGGLAAGTAGWLLAESTVDRELETHRWLGVATVVSALLLALSLEGRARGRGWRPLHVVLVVASGVLVCLAAHGGGEMVWGSDVYSDLTFLPQFLR